MRELLINKWYDFKDYRADDYRQVFNYEALYLDEIYRGGAHFVDVGFHDIIEELNYNIYEVLEKIIQDVEDVGIDYISMLGLGMSIKEWKTYIKELEQ